MLIAFGINVTRKCQLFSWQSNNYQASISPNLGPKSTKNSRHTCSPPFIPFPFLTKACHVMYWCLIWVDCCRPIIHGIFMKVYTTTEKLSDVDRAQTTTQLRPPRGHLWNRRMKCLQTNGQKRTKDYFLHRQCICHDLISWHVGD